MVKTQGLFKIANYSDVVLQAMPIVKSYWFPVELIDFVFCYHVCTVDIVGSDYAIFEGSDICN